MKLLKILALEYNLYLILSILFVGNSFCQQSQLDSLKTAFENEAVDSMRYEIGARIIILKKEIDAHEALVYADEILKDISIEKSPRAFCRLSYLKMEVLSRLGKYDDALELSNDIEKVANLHSFKSILLGLYNQKGLCYQQQSAFNKAANAYYDAFSLAKELNDLNVQIIALNNLANIYVIIKEFDKAEEYLLQSLQLSKSNNMQKNAGMVLTNLGKLENDRQNLSIARIYYKEALDIFIEIGLKYGEGLLYNNIGHLEFQARNYDMALDYFEKSIQVKKEIGDQFGLLSTYVNIGNVYKEKMKDTEALHYFEQAMTLAKSMKSFQKMELILTSMIEIYERTEKFTEALDTQERLMNLKDSLYAADINKNTDLKKTAIDSVLYNEKIDQLKKRNKILKQTNYSGWIAFMILLFSALIFWFKKKHQSKKIDEEKLNPRPSIDAHENKIHDLIESLKKGTLDGTFWMQFGLTFDEIHPNFSKTLTKDYPKITKSELRICCLIRLGLHNHDLSKCLNIAQKSVSNSRYRIYKKMGLSSDKEMVNYLFSL